MNFLSLITRNLIFYRKLHLGVLAGAALSTAILVGALVVGDSVRGSLKDMVFARLGAVTAAIPAGDRFVSASIADRIKQSSGSSCAALLMLPGIVSADGGARRVNAVQVLGVDDEFWMFAPHKTDVPSLDNESVILNSYLADRLGVQPGDDIIVRLRSQSALPGDVPIGGDAADSVAFRAAVAAVVDDRHFGRFSLMASQRAPYTIFLDREFIAGKLDLHDKANLVISALPDSLPALTNILERSLDHSLRLDDTGLSLHLLTNQHILELRSDRIFIDPPSIRAAMAANPVAVGILTYFVNSIVSGTNSTPYSFVSAPDMPVVPQDMADEEIIINQWLADDLAISTGAMVTLKYYVLGTMRTLQETSSVYRVRAVVPIAGPAADRNLMPDFPGLADAEHCRDWNPGVSIDLDRIRDKDEEYWNIYRGTPKAFVSLSAAQKMWRNRFGSLTAIRYPSGTVSPEDISAGIVSNLSPAALGLAVQPVKHQGLLAGSQGVDFGQLFLGLSFFIVIAALLLMGLLFVFSIEYRTRETGVLRALGFTVKQVRRLALCEGSVLAVLGSVIGSIIGIAYTQLILAALSTVWRGAVAAAVFSLHVRPGTVFIGIVSGIIVALMAMWIALRAHGTRPVSSLLASGMFTAIKGSRRGVIISTCICILSAAGAVLLSISANPRTGKDAAGIFFGAGALLLAAGISVTQMLLYYMRGKPSAQLTVRTAGIRNCIRRPGRSLTVAGILACGVFLVVAVAANRQNPLKDPEAASSGTGGFALYGETTLPILHSLNTAEGRRTFGLTASQLQGLSFVYLRVREGDDASCLNLNRVRRPRLLAVDPDEFSKRHSFTFAAHTDDIDPVDPWNALKTPLDDNTIPAVGDLSMIVWGLGKAVGDSIEYTDEHGRTFRIKLVGGLANSIFQGSLIVDRELFEQRYPSVSGANVILVNAPRDRIDGVQSMLSTDMEDAGLDFILAAQRLAEFAEVENTYLMIFLALGGLGLLLGSAGLGIIVLRISTERRGEFALLRAVGFSRHTMRRMVIWEHLFLMATGLTIGTIAALLAVLPAIASPAGDLPWFSLAILVLAICASGWLWIYLAASSTMRADLLVALRNE